MRRTWLLLVASPVVALTGTARAEDPPFVVDGAAVSPAEPRAGDALTCEPVGAVPRDVTLTTTWTVDGAAVDAPIAATYAEITCAIAATRKGVDGPPVVSAPVTVRNGLPVLAGVRLLPEVPRTGDTVTCAPGDATDPDGEAPFLKVRWTVDGAPIDEVGLELADVRAGQAIACVVTPMDATEEGAPVTAAVTVANTPPTATVSLAPLAPMRADPITCAATTADADGDAVTVAWSWTVAGKPVAATGATLASGYAKGDTVACTATPADPGGPGAPVTASVAIADAPPVAGPVAITPSAARAGIALTCAATGSDPDGEPVTTAIAWTVDGAAATPPIVAPKRGAKVACTVTPTAGGVAGAPATAELVVSNTPPVGTAPHVEPATPAITDALTCAPGEGTDADGDPVTWTFAWTVNGAPAGTGPTLPAGTAPRGSRAACTATPTDATDPGAPVTSAAIEVASSAPRLASVAIEPAAPRTTDPIRCVPGEATDPDGDPVRFRTAWTVDGAATPDTTDTLPAARTKKGATVTCAVTPTDGGVDGPPVSASVVVANTAPVVKTATITPASPATTDDLTCTPGAATDADGDAVTVAIAWTLDGKPAGEGATLAASATKKGQTAVCTATPYDGASGASGAASDGTPGEAATASVVVRNTPPSGGSAAITPEAATVSTALTCAGTGATDADGDPVSWTYAWSTGASGAALPAGVRKGTKLTCTGTPSDGEAAGKAVTAAITVANTPPTATSAAIAPAELRAGMAPTCEGAGLADADGDAVTARVGWTVDGAAVTGPIPASRVKRGATIGCAVTPWDGTVAGAPVTAAAITVRNTPPVIRTVTVSPASPVTTDTLTCAAGAATDADGDAVTVDLAWTIDGKPAGTGPTLAPDATRKGGRVVCTATPKDSAEAGEAVRSAEIVVRNTPPSIAGVTLTPEAPTTTAALTCAPGATSDADGDPVTPRFAWTVGGVAVEAGATLPAERTRKGDRVTCTVTPGDGEADGKAVSATVTVANTPPTLASATVTPASPRTDQDLSCETGATADADGDAVSIRTQWTIGDKTLPDTGKTLPSSRFARGDRVACAATPFDGSAAGEAVRASAVEVVNSPPRGGTARIDKPSPTTADTLGCVASGATDPDGDPVTWTYAWTVSGKASGTDRELAGSAFAKRDTVACAATPTDGTAAGAPVEAAPVTVRNSPPVLGAVTLTPSPAYTDSTVSPAADATDADGDALTTAWQWTIDGKPGPTTRDLPGSGALPGDGAFDEGAKLQLTVTVSDGDAPPVTAKSAVLVVKNAPPEAPLIEVTNPRSQTTDLLCRVAVASTDRDGDAITYDIAWTVDGVPYKKAATTTWKGDTVPKGATGADQEWTCVATPRDATEAGAPSEPVTVAIVVPTVGSGSSHSCAIEADGAVMCWGLGDYQTAVPPEGRFRRLAVGNWSNCAIRRARTLACWGHNVYGQSRPPDGEFREVSAGGYHACALDLTGHATCWGQSAGGRTAAPGDVFTAISAGGEHSCGITAAGELRCWGDDDHGQIRAPAGTFSKVSAGETHACAVSAAGDLACWGSNDVAESSPPAGGGFVDVVAGERFSCALRDDGTVTCWGLNNYGQHDVPGVGFRSIGRGVSGVCGWTVDGGLACWGNNQYGQARPPAVARE